MIKSEIELFVEEHLSQAIAWAGQSYTEDQVLLRLELAFMRL